MKLPLGAALGAAALLAACATVAPPVPAGIERTTREVEFEGATVLIDVYRPAATPRSWVLLAHGFTRHRGTMAALAAALARAGHAVIVPDLPQPADQVANAGFIADLARREADQAPLILAGFSAGALASLLAVESTSGVIGWIGLDPVDRAGRGAAVASRLAVPAIVLRAPPASCNARGNFAPTLAAVRTLLQDRVFAGASHCDFESPTDGVCRLACGAETPELQHAVQEAFLAAAERLATCAKSAGCRP